MKITEILLGVMLVSTASCQEIHAVKVAVTEEDGTPVEGVKVETRYLGYGARDEETNFGTTNAKGYTESKGSADLRIHVFAKKSGYYDTESGRLSRKEDHDLIVVLRRVKTPVPLFSKRFRGKVPGLGEKYGFDFKAGDWVAPYGEGEKVDTCFRVDLIKDEEGKDGGKLEVSFPHEKEGASIVDEGNGYLPLSKMHMPQSAFEDGYQGVIERVETGYQNESKKRNTSYFLRTRAQKTNNGEFIYNYAKFKDGVDFFMSGGVFLEGASRKRNPDEVGVVTFTYYFNPTPNDRNLEFDTQRNLFKDLGAKEQVREP